MPEQGWNHWQALDSLIAKSGCVEPITDALRQRLQVSRFTSTKHSLPYAAYLDAIARPAGGLAVPHAAPTPRFAECPTPREGALATPRAQQR